MKKKQLVLNTPLRGLPAGAIVAVDFEGGIPADPYWRARMEDARHDGCVEIVTVKKHRETKVTGPDETKSPDKTPDKTTEKKG